MGVLERLGTSGPALGAVVVSTICVYAVVVLLTRLSGPRSLAKMSSFDFAATVAVGSTLASTALGSTALANGAAVLVLLFGLQAVVGVLRRRGAFGGLVDNRPLLLMAGPEVLDDHLRQARISREELFAQLRSSGVHRLEQVTAVVLETTGDLSVLTGGAAVDPVLLAGVRGGEHLR
jgi:uncharacterized membrane protein YcaP (DUF421 family)